MNSAASSTTLLIEPTSAWVVLLVVSAVVLVVVTLVRRIITGGGIVVTVLATLPLALPLLVALFYRGGIFPEVAVLRPGRLADVISGSKSIDHLIFMSQRDSEALVPYILSGTAGRTLILIGASMSAFMLLRRLTGRLVVARLARRCIEPDPDDHGYLTDAVARLARSAGLRSVPQVLILPPAACGAFAVGRPRPRILVAPSLLEKLDDQEVEAVLAHEIAHLASRDMYVMAWAGVLRDMTVWNPVSHLALRQLTCSLEFEADRRAATITNNPLALASGLLKMYELLKSRPTPHPRPTLMGLLRSRDRLSQRITRMIALADDARIADRQMLPCLIAAVFVVVVALQVGAAVSSMKSAPIAIVLGTPEVDDVDVWSMPRHENTLKLNPPTGGIDRTSLFKGAGLIGVRRDDLWNWLSAARETAEARGLPQNGLLVDGQGGWEAVPVFDGSVGPFGIYRVQPAFAPPKNAAIDRPADDPAVRKSKKSPRTRDPVQKRLRD